MRVPIFPIVASLALLATPAFAQNAQTGTNGDQNGTPGYTTNGMTGNGSYNGTGGYNGSGAYNGGNSGMTGAYNQGAQNSWTKGANVTPNTRERIRQSLQQSGFRDVSATPEAFVIHAMAPDGSHIVMLLRPDELTGVIESGSSGGNGNYGNSGWNGGANTNNSGDNGGGANR